MRVERIADNLAGINRLRQKGGASKDDLYDLLNGYRTPLGTVNSRPGTSFEFAFPANTKGALGFGGKIHTFSHTSVSHAIPNLVVHRIRHPTGGGAALEKIYTSFPHFGRIYVVAEYTDGARRHFWLEEPAAWQSAHVYAPGDSVQPTTPNGYYYDAQPSARVDLKWAPNTEKVAGDIVQPTVYNGLYYELLGSAGTPLKTSNKEPVWPNFDSLMGGIVIERRYLSDADLAPGYPSEATTPIPGPGGQGPYGGAGEYGPFPPDYRHQVPI